MGSSLDLGMSVLATALFDWTLALAVGLLLAEFWLRGSVRVPRVRTAALLMGIALVAQFYMLVAMMTGEAGLKVVLGSVPLVAGTHAGKVALATLGTVVLLLVVELVRALRRVWVSAVLVGLVVMLHSATGHAAVNGDFSGAEVLQWLHLSGMALWVGGVIVSGLFVLPRLAASGARVEVGYLRALSRVSTWAVAAVLLSGALKGWSGLDHQLHGLVTTGWGRILLGKLVLVVGALVLGWLHRRWIRAWTPEQSGTLGTTLRVEAVVLTLVIAVSAWLASVDPGMS